MRIAFVNMATNKKPVTDGKTHLLEPIHLLAMANICSQKGHDVRINQYGIPTHAETVSQVHEFKPDVLALSFIGHDKKGLDGAHQILSSFPKDRMPRLIIGGPDVTWHYDFYLKELIKYFEGSDINVPFIIALGEGERLMDVLANSGFDLFKDASSINALKKGLVGKGYLLGEEFAVVGPFAHVPLDEQSYIRTYPNLSDYSNTALVKWAAGCFGNCRFCSNVPAKPDYRSPANAVREYNYLSGIGSERIIMASPDFINNPRKATETLAAMPDNRMFLEFTARIDTLHYAIAKYPEVWRRISKRPMRIQIGLESLIDERLGPDRLGKLSTIKLARRHTQMAEAIFKFFEGSNVEFCVFFIPFDPKVTLDELEQEYSTMLSYTTKYRNLILPNLAQRLLPAENSPITKEHPQGSYFHNYKTDPRTYFLLHAFKDLYSRYDKRRKSGGALNHLPAIIGQDAALKFMLYGIKRFREIPVDSFDMVEILKGLGEDPSTDEVLITFYSHMSLNDAKALKKDMEREYDRLFSPLEWQATKVYAGRVYRTLFSKSQV